VTGADPGAKTGNDGNGSMSGSGENMSGPEQRIEIPTNGTRSVFVNSSQTLVPVSGRARSPTISVPSPMNACLPSCTVPPGLLAPMSPLSMNASLPSPARSSPRIT